MKKANLKNGYKNKFKTKIKKIIASAILCPIIALVGINAHASFAKNQATLFLIFYIDKAYAPLHQIVTLTRLYYQQYGACPSNNRFQLTLPDDTVFSSLANKGCVAVIKFKATDVPAPLQGKTIGMGPRYNTLTNLWHFSDMLFATDISSQLAGEFQAVTGSPSAILSQSVNFIGAVYTADPIGYLSDKVSHSFIPQ